MDVSENRVFSLQIIHLNRVFHYKPSILGYPYFWKHPYGKESFKTITNLNNKQKSGLHTPPFGIALNLPCHTIRSKIKASLFRAGKAIHRRKGGIREKAFGDHVIDRLFSGYFRKAEPKKKTPFPVKRWVFCLKKKGILS